ncbi:MAG TPA: hypothetical protein VMH83_00440 [Candidatus Acidoferrum sp.]|nr:hypothetical protein [Candidatus Acidoferrum sp.]
MKSIFTELMHIVSRLALPLLASVLCARGAAAQPGSDEYALMGYDGPATHNRVAALADKLASGAVKLEYKGNRGYLDSLLAALDIDPHSQLLVFSKTSLQYPLIDGDHPRAVYFNDDTYIGWVQNSNLVEVMTMDDALGVVFYLFHNVDRQEQPFDRQSQRCLVCHDSSGAAVGGTPQLMAASSVYNFADNLVQDMNGNDNVTDKTPLEKRWGGWYVSGLSGKQKHLGNVRLQSSEQLPQLDKLLRLNLPTLTGHDLFDTAPYLRDTSDIVALLVLEHQLTVENQLTYVRFKAPAVLARNGLADAAKAATWAGLPDRGQKVLTRMLDELVRLMLLTNAASFADRIDGSAEFQHAFVARGPVDGSGRSLRQFDLQHRLFRYPLSYLIYSSYFDHLPGYAKDYVYLQLAAVLEGRRQEPSFNQLTDTQRRDLVAILRATKPEFVPYLTR